MEIHEKKILINEIELIQLFNYNDEYLELIDKRFHSLITLRGNNLIVKGNPDEIKTIEKIIKELIYIFRRNAELKVEDVSSVVELLDTDKKTTGKNKINKDSIIFWGIRNAVIPRNERQLEYYKKVCKSDMVFAIGPAGTGKTFLAIAMALSSLKNQEVNKIILSRPAVEAGESLGFLPGDLNEKLAPYLRPLMDALYFMIGPDKVKSMMEKNIIEITPLAYMRGRTLNNAFIILDEAQNSTITQMKMFLTRMGSKSKVIITGDITQIDLKSNSHSGLINACKILNNINGIKFQYFTKSDVVRHKLVAKIIDAYEKEDNSRTGAGERNKRKL